jgi:hypothetical protein
MAADGEAEDDDFPRPIRAPRKQRRPRSCWQRLHGGMHWGAKIEQENDSRFLADMPPELG